MKYLETEQEKKSLTATTIFFVILFLIFFYLKFNITTTVPELEGGGGGGELAINFGNSDLGSGKEFESIDIVQPTTKATKVADVQDDDIVTQETEDAPVIAQVKKIIKKEVEKKPIIKEEPKPKPSKSTTDALSSILNSSNAKSGDGDDNVAGNKGKANGDPNARGYNGGGGSGTGSGGGNGSGQGLGTGSGYGTGNGSGRGTGNGSYQLSGRKFLTKPQPQYTCNEEGTVVVQISVNKSGKVISAEPGIRGTTNAAKCLLDQAKIAAMNTVINASADAPDKQVGKIIYNFKLTD
ncbi:energy transducer TonB [Flavobacterium sp. '19STA2R22 D10 B1']|uniref:energy transducer TonB family protein n=1 Tax=Flavobacterium aerium TaxID=3037261 RepID=UPI00278C4B9F|nr:energy transducer TonB [Flavobacterium sp. '19STA2R22 D10 B1']